MTLVSPPPIYQPLIDDSKNPVASPPWILFFNSLFVGDTGNVFTPVFTNLTVVGTPTYSAAYYKIGQNLCYYSVTITPATSVSATAGSTYFNFPLTLKKDGACLAISGLLGSSAGMADAATNRVYIPSLSGVTVPVTIVGLAEIR